MYTVLLRPIPQDTSTDLYIVHNFFLWEQLHLKVTWGQNIRTNSELVLTGSKYTRIFRCTYTGERNTMVFGSSLQHFLWPKVVHGDLHGFTGFWGNWPDLSGKPLNWGHDTDRVFVSNVSFSFFIMCFHVSPLDVLPIKYVQICSQNGHDWQIFDVMNQSHDT